VKNRVSKFAFQMQPAVLHGGGDEDEATMEPFEDLPLHFSGLGSRGLNEVGRCRLNQVDP
jgi:hypothetical protein